MMSSQLFSSNRLEWLGEQFCERVFSSFGRKIVIVPSDEVKLFLQNLSLKKKGIFFGMHFMSLKGGLTTLLELLDCPASFPTSTQAALFLEKALDLDLTAKRKGDLAELLSRLFLRYGREAGQEFLKWREEKGWQNNLYNKLFSEWDDLITFFPKLSFPDTPSVKLEIHLFGLSNINPLHFAYFEKFSEVWPVHYYFLTPSSHYLGDIVSEKERVKIYRENRDDELDQMLRDRNLLIANLGKVGRRIQGAILDFDLADKEEFYFHEEPQSQLESLQNEVFDCLPYGGAPSDDSLMVHSAPSLLREVEVMKMVVENLLMEHPDWEPADFLIMAPNIASYLPAIELTFANSPLSYTLSDIPLLATSEHLQAFKQLFDLVGGGFEVDQVLSFLSLPLVREHLKLPEPDEMEEWARKAHVRFGLDREGRDRYLSRFAEEDRMVDESGIGTFEEAMRHLIMGLVMPPTDTSEYFPATILDFSQAEGLGNWCAAVEKLSDSLHHLEESSLTLAEWSSYLLALCDHFFKKGAEKLGPFLMEIEALAAKLPDKTFHFASLKKGLVRAFSKGTLLRSQERNSLLFTGLKAGRAVPAKVIYLMGLENFPGRESFSSLDQFPRKISVSDEDRFLFLELLLSARAHLILSYVSISQEDGKRIPPSPLIEELKRYLKGQLTLYEHPAYRFHPGYFGTSRWKNFSEHDYRALKGGEKPTFTLLNEPPKREVIKLQELHLLARNPFKFFLNQALGIYLPYEESYKEAEFVLPFGERARLKRLNLEGTLSLDLEGQRGVLPHGLFRDVAKMSFEKEGEEVPLWTIELRADVTAPSVAGERHIILPPLEVGGTQIVGHFPPISQEGLLSGGKKTSVEKAKIWPLYLAYLQLPLEELGCGKGLVFENGVELFEGDAEELLRNYLIYFHEALKSPSPLHPDLVKSFQEGESAFTYALNKRLVDPHFLYLKNQQIFSEPRRLYEEWAPHRCLIF